MASRLLPWRSWNWMMFSAVCISSRSCPACAPVSHSRSMSCSSRPYLLMRCTGFSRYEDRSILSPSSCCFCCNSHHITINKQAQHQRYHDQNTLTWFSRCWMKICLKRTFHVSSCLFINNMSSTRFLYKYIINAVMFLDGQHCIFVMCVSSLEKHPRFMTVDLFWQVFCVEICKSSCHSFQVETNFIQRVPISKRMAEIRPAPVFAQYFTFYQMCQILHYQINYFTIFILSSSEGIFPCYFASWVEIIYVCNTFHTNVQMLLLRVKEYWIHRLISLYL